VRAPVVLTGAGLVLLAVLAHAPALGAGFVYDDHRFIEANPALRSIDPVAYFTDPATASATDGIRPDVYRPLRTLDFAVTYALFGLDPRPWHLVNLLLHAANVLLLARLLAPLVRGSHSACAAGAALFAVHPVGVEAVAWVSSRGDLLSVLLLLAALLVLERPGGGRTFAGLLLGTAACFAKESAVVFPALLVLRDLALPAERRPPAHVRWMRAGLATALVGAYLAVRLTVIPDFAQVSEFIGGSRAAAGRGMLAGLAWYARALLWPRGFDFDVQVLPPLVWSDPAVVLGLGLLATLLAGGALALRSGRGLVAFSCLGALACLVPVSNVLVPLKALVAERFLYPVLLCVAAGLAGLLLALPGRLRLAGLGVVVLLAALLVPVTRSRAGAWKDEMTLWETVLEARPDHMRAYEGLGFEYLRRGRLRDAEIAYRSYLEANPADGKSMRLLGDAFGKAAADIALLPGQRPEQWPDLPLRRQQARISQLQWYRAALSAWERVGLVTGRASPEMVLQTLERAFEAAWELGDLPKAKEVNDAMLRLEGVDPSDPEGVCAHASAPRRRWRLALALRGLLTRPPAELAAPQYEQMLAQRALVLRDVGLDPARGQRTTLLALGRLYDGFLEEPGATVFDGLNRVQIDLELEDRATACGRLERLLGRFPGDPAVGAWRRDLCR
jgi:tetratricopeptide (TPR) repeat protein